MIICITGLKIKSIWVILRFYAFSIPCVVQAKKTPGNLICKTTKVNGVYHTMTVWKNKTSMKKFSRTGIHKKAMKAFSTISKEAGAISYESNTIPTWKEALQLWNSKVEYYKFD